MEGDEYRRALRAQALSVLQRALAILDGKTEVLAQRLEARVEEVALWLGGAHDIPQAKVDAAVDLILRDLDEDRLRKRKRRGPV